jgi:CubicO group peptidase (beta-lactamase class C family)
MSLCTALFITILAHPSDGQKPPGQPGGFSPITDRVQGWVDKGYYPGAAVLIARNNRVLYEHSFGTYTPDTEVFIASAGKWLAAATIMSVVDQGKLSLDDPASKWLPELKGSSGRATLRQMLAHTSGYLPYQPDDRPTDNYQTLRESVAHGNAVLAQAGPGHIPGLIRPPESTA